MRTTTDLRARRKRGVAIGAVLGCVAAAAAWQPAQPAPARPPSPQPPAQAPGSAGPGDQAPAQGKEAPRPASPAPSGPEAAAHPGEPREVVVILNDGQRYSGMLVVQDAEKVVLKIAGIDTSIPMSRVERVQVLSPVAVRYRTMRAAIDDNDTERLVLLAEWLRARSQWDSALFELDHVLTIQPDNPEAKRLRVLVESQKKLAEKAGTAHGAEAHPAPAPAPARDPAKPDNADASAFPLLSDHDVNLIKVYEVDLTDPPRLSISRDAIKQLVEQHGSDPLVPATEEGREALFRDSAAKVLDLMFRLQARNLYSQVKVIDEPHAMRLFRDEVHRGWLMNSCATARCHGGSEASRLMLDNQRTGTDAVVYTNFLILERFRLADGTPLINYNQPSDSPLLQMALPRSGSKYPHPVVPANEGRGDLWKPIFKSPEDKRFQDAVEWIKSMYRPRPDYPVNYVAPTPQGIQPPPPGEPPVVR